MQGYFNIHKLVIHHIKKLNNKSYITISVHTKKAFDKIQHSFTVKKRKRLQKVGIEVTYLNITQAIYGTSSANIILNSEKLKSFSLRSRTRKGIPLSQIF